MFMLIAYGLLETVLIMQETGALAQEYRIPVVLLLIVVVALICVSGWHALSGGIVSKACFMLALGFSYGHIVRNADAYWGMATDSTLGLALLFAAYAGLTVFLPMMTLMRLAMPQWVRDAWNDDV